MIYKIIHSRVTMYSHLALPQTLTKLRWSESAVDTAVLFTVLNVSKSLSTNHSLNSESATSTSQRRLPRDSLISLYRAQSRRMIFCRRPAYRLLTCCLAHEIRQCALVVEAPSPNNFQHYRAHALSSHGNPKT